MAGKRILVYGSMGDIAGTVATSLRNRGLEVLEVGFPQNTFRDEFGYARGLRKAVASFSPDVIMPVGDVLAASRMKKELPEGTVMPVDTPEKIALLNSKVDSSALASSLGIPQPEIYRDADSAAGREIIFKRDKSFGGSGVYRPRTKEALVNLMNHEPGGRFLIEEYVEGYDFSIDAVRWNDFWHVACYKSLRNHGGQGPSILRESAGMPVLEKYARKILDKLDFQGVCGMDFRIDADGNVYFLECNPRFTGGLATQVEAGFDIPWMLWKCYMEI